LSLRFKIIVYLVLIHTVLAVISFVVLRENRLWLLAVEGLFVLSIVLGGLLAEAPRQKQLVHLGRRLQRPAALLRVGAAAGFRRAVRGEQAALGALLAIARALGAPLRDLHTGDAQEYLLLLAGVSMLALLLPLLR
jgi:hypothetical protein